jgi:hypothetical protein
VRDTKILNFVRVFFFCKVLLFIYLHPTLQGGRIGRSEGKCNIRWAQKEELKIKWDNKTRAIFFYH